MTEDMSAEERAHLLHPDCLWGHDATDAEYPHSPLCRATAEAIRQAEAAAVAREREACAEIAESQHLGGGYILSNYGKNIAVKIRARSEP